MLGYSDNGISGCSQPCPVPLSLLNAAKSTTSTSVVQPFTSQIGCSLYAIIPSRMKNLLCSGTPFLAPRFDYFKTSLLKRHLSRLNVLNLNILIKLRSISDYEITNFQPQNEINNHSAQPHNFQFQNNSKPDPLKRSQNLPSYKSRILNVGEPNSPENNAPHPSQQENLHSSHFTWL